MIKRAKFIQDVRNALFNNQCELAACLIADELGLKDSVEAMVKAHEPNEFTEEDAIRIEPTAEAKMFDEEIAPFLPPPVDTKRQEALTAAAVAEAISKERVACALICDRSETASDAAVTIRARWWKREDDLVALVDAAIEEGRRR